MHTGQLCVLVLHNMELFDPQTHTYFMDFLYYNYQTINKSTQALQLYLKKISYISWHYLPLENFTQSLVSLIISQFAKDMHNGKVDDTKIWQTTGSPYHI